MGLLLINSLPACAQESCVFWWTYAQARTYVTNQLLMTEMLLELPISFPACEFWHGTSCEIQTGQLIGLPLVEQAGVKDCQVPQRVF